MGVRRVPTSYAASRSSLAFLAAMVHLVCGLSGPICPLGRAKQTAVLLSLSSTTCGHLGLRHTYTSQLSVLPLVGSWVCVVIR